MSGLLFDVACDLDRADAILQILRDPLFSSSQQAAEHEYGAHWFMQRYSDISGALWSISDYISSARTRLEQAQV